LTPGRVERVFANSRVAEEDGLGHRLGGSDVDCLVLMMEDFGGIVEVRKLSRVLHAQVGVRPSKVGEYL
jgi:hypothetical protein